MSLPEEGAPRAGAHGPPPTLSACSRWASTQWAGKNLARVGIELKAHLLAQPGWLGDFCRISRSVAKSSAAADKGAAARHLLPLPFPAESLEEYEWSCRRRGAKIPDLSEKTDKVLEMAAGVQAWSWCIVAALNFVHGGRGPAAVRQAAVHGPPSPAQEASLMEIRSDAAYFLRRHGGVVPAGDWTRELAVRRVKYDGEEIGAAQPLSLARVLPALPAAGNCGRICATEIATGQVRALLLDPLATLRPRGEWAAGRLRAQCMHQADEGDAIAHELLGRGMCELIGEELLVATDLGPVLNGWFGVGKGKYLAGFPATPEYEVLRLIMHFVPVNTLFHAIEGDVSCLPYFGQWSVLQLESWQYFAWSSEDIACMFYIFRVPAVWRPYMAFNCGTFRRPDRGGLALAAAVLGMGWLSSVGVAQHLIRELALRAPKLGADLPPARELRRDAEMPRGGLIDKRLEFWSVYMDDFDVCEIDEKEEVVRRVGELHEWQIRLREAYEAWGIPRGEDKAVCRSIEVERLGAALDGRAGRAHGTGKKLLQLVSLALFLLQLDHVPKTLVEMVVGRFIHRMQFRRPSMGMLARVWKYLRRWGNGRQLPLEVEEDLLLALASSPLMYMDFRAVVDEAASCSDASPTGNGVCIAVGCTAAGRALSEALLEEPRRSKIGGCGLLLVGLFDGIGGLRRSAEVAGLPIVGAASVESDKGCRRIVELMWPDTVRYEDVRSFDVREVDELRRKFPRTSRILLGAGFPCQEYSGLNTQRRGITSARGSLVQEIPRIRQLLEERFGVPVDLLAECVASMDEAQRHQVDRVLGVEGVRICSGKVAWCRRPRLYWISWAVDLGDGAVQLGREQPRTLELTAVRPPLRSILKKNVEPSETFTTFLTFTRALPEKKPGHKLRGLERISKEEAAVWALDRYRFAPYQYQLHNLVWDSSRWRSLNANEREVIMGFNPQHTAGVWTKTERSGDATGYEDARVSAVGNSWAVQVTGWLVGQLGACLGLLEVAPSTQEIVSRCMPKDSVRHGNGAGVLAGPSATAPPLVSQLLQLVDHTGGLLRKRPGTTELSHVYPMRPLNAGLWRWRVLVAAQWHRRIAAEHINKLELRSLLTALRWRARRAPRHGQRVLHLVDSMVALGADSRARSPSRDLQGIVDTINTTVLAARLRLVLAHVVSAGNPADAPSRRRLGSGAKTLYKKIKNKFYRRAGAHPAGEQ